MVLAVPFLDTGFVVAKRIKYGRPVYRADRWHFHHRMANIGFSQRRTVLYLYGWMLLMAGIAVALRFIPYSQSDGTLNAGWAVVMGAMLLAALAASVYLVYVLEILKFKRLAARRVRRARPEATEDDVEADVSAAARDGRVGGGRALSAGSGAWALSARRRERTQMSQSAPTSSSRRGRLVLHEALVEDPLGHPAQRERDRLGWPGAPRPAACSRSMRRRVADVKRPIRPRQKRGDLLVVGRDLDDRAQQHAVLVVERGDARQRRAELLRRLAAAREPARRPGRRAGR